MQAGRGCIYPERDARVEHDIRTRVDDALLHGQAPDAQTACLIHLAVASLVAQAETAAVTAATMAAITASTVAATSAATTAACSASTVTCS